VEGALRRSAPDGLRLIETLRWEPAAGFPRLPPHLDRLGGGAAALGVAFDRGAVERALGAVCGSGPLRVRLTLGLDGGLAVETAPLPATKPEWVVRVAEARVASADPWLRLKTTERRLYDAARASLPEGADEVVFLNERGEVCEGTITNVFLDLGGDLLTPPAACGLLPGVLRAELLASRICREAVLAPADLARGRLFVGNALRGLIPARLAR
jgi:4-amino-4-deoxychorismate lyase